MIIRFFFCSIVLLFCITSLTYATVFRSNGTGGGDWTLSSSWENIDGDGELVPDENDVVTILADDTIIISTLSTRNWERFENLTINLDGTIQINSGCKLRGWGSGTTASLVNNGSIIGSGEIVSDVTTTISGTGSYSSSTNFWAYGTMNLKSMTADIGGIFKIEGILNIKSSSDIEFTGTVYCTNSSKELNNQGTIRVSTPNFLASGGPSTNVLDCNYSTSKIIFNQSGSLILPKNNQFNDLTNTAALTSSSNFSIKGEWDNSSSFSSLSSGNEITFNGSSNQEIKGGGTFTLQKLTFSNDDPTKTLTLSSSDITIHQALESTNGIIKQEGANIILESSTLNDETGIVKVKTSSDYNYQSGDFTAKRYFQPSQNSWRMISSPIIGATLNDVNSEFMFCGILPVTTGNYHANSCGGWHSVITYDNTGPSWNNITSIGQSISQGVGTLIYHGQETPEGPIPPVDINITGEPNFANTSVPISDVGDAFNLVSNPYPTTIDWSAFSAANSINSLAYYIYDEAAGNFELKSGDISSHQSFFVKATAAGNLNFNVNTTINDYNQAFQRSTNGINDPLKLSVFSEVNNYYDYAYLYTGPNFSNGYDLQSELEELFPTETTFDYAPSLYFVVDDSSQINLNHINNSQSTELFIDTRIGKYAHGLYTLNFSDIQKFMPGSCLILEDLYNGVVTDLRLDSMYTFNSDSLAPYPRFKMNILLDYDINVTNLSCFENSSGFIDLSGNSIEGYYFSLYDFSGNYIDSIEAISNTIRFDNLNSGFYTLTTNHQGSCSLSSQQIIINQPDNLIANFISNRDTIYLDSNGNSEIRFENLSLGSSFYNWDFGDGNFSTQTNPVHNYSSEGDYTVVLYADNDSLGLCTDIFEKNVTVLDQSTNTNSCLINPINISIDSTGFINCATLVNANVSGGTGIYAYEWENGQTSQEANYQNGGFHQIIVTDNSGCRDTASVFFNSVQLPEISILTQNISCFGMSDGQISLSANGLATPYSYLWENGTNNPNIDSLDVGDYSVTVFDTNNCEISEIITIISPDEIEIDFNVYNSECPGQNNGRIEGSISGGIAPFSFSWSNNQSTQNIYNLQPGDYFLEVQDANGCMIDSSFTIINEYQSPITGNIGGPSHVQIQSIEQYFVTEDLNSTYYWNALNGNIISGQGTNSVFVEWSNVGNGNLTVLESNSYGCNGDTIELAVLIENILSFKLFRNQSTINIYPNPTKNLISIDLNEDIDYFVELLDLYGRILESGFKSEVSLLSFPKGVYFLRFYFNNKIENIKIIKQ